VSIIIGARSELTPGAVKRLHEFRHEIFVQRLGWRLPLVDGSECDQYDLPDTMYVMECDADGRVRACARLLRTTSSYMLPEVFGQLLGSASAPCDAKIWELSRLAVSVRATGSGRALSFSSATLHLLNVVRDFVAQHAVERVVMVTTLAIERLILRSGLQVSRVAAPANVCGEICVAIFIEVPQGPGPAVRGSLVRRRRQPGIRRGCPTLPGPRCQSIDETQETPE